MKIYLASPLFTDYEREKVKAVAEWLRSNNHEVYVTMEHSIENAWDYSNADWVRMVFEEDVKAIRESDEVWCIYYGLYPDSGTAWECGFAYALGKRVHLIDQSNKEVSLMVVNGSVSAKEFFDKSQT